MGISYLIDKSDKKKYYQLLRKNLRTNYENYLNYNLEYVLVRKSFTRIHPQFELLKNSISSYSWLSYLLEQLIDDKNSLRRDWKQFLFEDIQQKLFLNQYEFQNDIYFEELSINKPKYKKNKQGEHFLESEPIVFTMNADELKNYKENKNIFDIDTRLTENLNFSFNSGYREDDSEGFLYNYTMDYDDNSSRINSPEYKMKYNSYILKKYIKIIRKHIEKKDHPIQVIIDQFIFFFGSFLKLNIDFCKNNQNDEKICSEKVLEVVKEIQNFIEIMQVTLKLFYAKSINFKIFVDEKDEIINLISYILFNKKKFYKQLLDLFSYMNNEKKEKLKLKLENSDNITPSKAGIGAKFRLDSDSEEYWKEYKNKSKDKNENSDKTSTEDETASKQRKEELKHCIHESKEELLSKNEPDSMSYTNRQSFSKDIKSGKNNIIIDLEKSCNFEKNDFDKTYSQHFNINIKEKLENDLKGSIITNLPKEPNENEIISPDKPYSLAINYLKQITNYKVPLEKLIIISYLSELIIKSVDKYWEKRKEEMPPNFLNLDADEIMSIYLYVIYKANLITIVDQIEFIKHFTTSITKQSIFGYYYSTFEGCLRYLQKSEEK